MKDLAKHMARARVSPSHKARQPRDYIPKPPNEAPSPPKVVPNEIPDAWDVKHRPDMEERAKKARAELKARKEREASLDIYPEDIEEAEEHGFEFVKRKRVSKKKRRHLSMTMAVSEEEEAIIRAHVAKLETSFSAWARQTLFRAMGRKLPARPKRY